MKKTLLVSLFLVLGPVAASAGDTSTGDNGLSTMLTKACAVQPGNCDTVERKKLIE
jgi:hypothetical protein